MPGPLFTKYPDSPYRVPTATHGDPLQSTFDLEALPTDARSAEISKEKSKAQMDGCLGALQELQALLYADNSRSVLVVLQAIDAGGKDSTIRRVFGYLNPQGVRVWSFKQPSDLELAHDFLWRYHDRTPPRGMIGIFNRSHYEAVLVERVKELTPEVRWRRRYSQINAFEQMLVSEGTVVLKFFLNLSAAEQAERFRDRLTKPNKWWKFSAADLEERRRWPQYRAAFRDALAACSTPWAPWYAIPADQKWHRDHVIASIVQQTLESMDLAYPSPEPGIDEKIDAFLKELDKPLPEA